MFVKVGEIKNLCIKICVLTVQSTRGWGGQQAHWKGEKFKEILINWGVEQCASSYGQFQVWVGTRYMDTEWAKERGDSSLKFVRSWIDSQGKEKRTLWDAVNKAKVTLVHLSGSSTCQTPGWPPAQAVLAEEGLEGQQSSDLGTETK